MDKEKYHKDQDWKHIETEDSHQPDIRTLADGTGPEGMTKYERGFCPAVDSIG